MPSRNHPSIRALFVYGSLRPDCRPSNREAARVGRALDKTCHWLGPATVGGRIYRQKWYPALVPGGIRKVKGMLARMHRPARILALLDHYEEAGAAFADPEYKREPRIICWRGQRILAWTYIWARPLRGLRPIASNDFRRGRA